MGFSSGKVKAWRHNTKKKLIDCLGGKCNRCGYNRCFDALEFHHLDESKKEFTISSAMVRPRKWELLVEEVKKCILLCSICHRELHTKLWKLEDIDIVEPTGFDSYDKIKEPTGQCPICGIDIFGGGVTCSPQCSAKKRIKCKWPDKEELLRLTKLYPRIKIAEMLGVSDSAVAKREKQYGIFEYKLIRKKKIDII